MARRSLTTFLVTTVALLAIVVIGTRLLPKRIRHLPIAQSHESPGPGYYLSTDNATTLDQLVFYHGLENIAEPLRNADVILAGNSRSLFGFPESVCNGYFGERGLRWFHAGFPSENNVFTQHILEQYDCRPKMVIVNADNFFTGNMSMIARRSIDTSTFGAQKLYWESRLSYRCRHRLHAWLPHPPTMFFASESMIVHRSLRNGSWRIGESRGEASGVNSVATMNSASDSEIEFATQFKQFVEQRGAELVLTYVPSQDDNRDRAKQIANAIGCRFVSPQIADLTTIDGSHLDAHSARRFATATLQHLDGLRTAHRLETSSHVSRRP